MWRYVGGCCNRSAVGSFTYSDDLISIAESLESIDVSEQIEPIVVTENASTIPITLTDGEVLQLVEERDEITMSERDENVCDC